MPSLAGCGLPGADVTDLTGWIPALVSAAPAELSGEGNSVDSHQPPSNLVQSWQFSAPGRSFTGIEFAVREQISRLTVDGRTMNEPSLADANRRFFDQLLSEAKAVSGKILARLRELQASYPISHPAAETTTPDHEIDELTQPSST